MNQKQYPEILLVRFTKAQKVWIRQTAKRMKDSEASIVRIGIDTLIELSSGERYIGK